MNPDRCAHCLCGLRRHLGAGRNRARNFWRRNTAFCTGCREPARSTTPGMRPLCDADSRTTSSERMPARRNQEADDMKQALLILTILLGTVLAACGGNGEELVPIAETATRAYVAATPAPEPTPATGQGRAVPDTASPEPTPAPTPAVELARKQTTKPTRRRDPLQEPQPGPTAEELSPKPETDQPQVYRNPGQATSTLGAPAPTPQTGEANSTQKKPLKYPNLGSRLNEMAVTGRGGRGLRRGDRNRSPAAPERVSGGNHPPVPGTRQRGCLPVRARRRPPQPGRRLHRGLRARQPAGTAFGATPG